MKNYLGQGLGLTFLVLLGLIGLSLIPENTTLGSVQLRRMDILSDVRDKASLPEQDTFVYVPDTLAYTDFPADSTATDSTLHQDSVHIVGPLPPVDSMFFGSTIEDYTPDQSGLSRFFKEIDSIRTHGHVVRVAFYGDSFVEGDILIGDLRDTLQTMWGGNGVGFVPITSEVARFKRTLVHDYKGWRTFSIVKNHEAKVPFGLNGFVYYPDAGASLTYQGAKYFHHTQAWSQVRLFYATPENSYFTWKQKDMPERQQATLNSKGDAINLWTYESPQPDIRLFSMQFPASDNLRVYGASLESGAGFYIDNFSVRGNSGGPLKRISTDLVKQFDRYQHYDLVVIQVGLNAVTNSLNNINWYKAELDRTFDHLRACFPGRPILVVSVGDRAGKFDGELTTMRSVPYIVAMQRDLARKHGFLFYDLYRGMGGPGSIITMANHKPMLANKDYTHLTHEGGRVVGYMFARLFLSEQQKYRSKMQQSPPQ
jgi:hypothetical protein